MEAIQTQEDEVSPVQKHETNSKEKIPIFAFYNWATTYVHEQEVKIGEALKLLYSQPS